MGCTSETMQAYQSMAGVSEMMVSVATSLLALVKSSCSPLLGNGLPDVPQ